MLKNNYRRTPRNYDGTEVTSRKISDLLPYVLSEIGGIYQQRPDLLLAAWPEIIGAKLAPMTEAASFSDGVLFVKVRNSSLLSLLIQNEKNRLLSLIRKKFPSIKIDNIIFRLG